MNDLISRQAAHKWETCFECPLSYGCPKIKGCTNEQAIEYASQIPNDCPLSAQSERKTDGDTISRQAAIDALEKVAELYPWRVPGDRDSYSQYNEAWQDALNRADSEIEALPPTKLEITHCAECIHWKHSDVRKNYCEVFDWMNTADDFCSFAERRSDE